MRETQTEFDFLVLESYAGHENFIFICEDGHFVGWKQSHLPINTNEPF